ncbi:MAG: PASTA domain-containing protein, partial [Phycisphaerales bacterium]
MNHIRSGVVGGVICAAVILLSCAGALGAVEFAGGTGEPNNPYQIATAEQLIAIGSDPNLANSHFVLTASIDLSGTTWWSPVIPCFYGSFDGNGFGVQGFKARGLDSIGLFGQIQATGRVADLRVVDADLTGVSYVGALAAYNWGAIYDCSSSGSVTGVGQDVGGLVGRNSGTIAGSSSAGDVTGNAIVGGLVGTNGGILKDCCSTPFALGSSDVGGLAGSNSGIVSGCYADGHVIGASELGGLVGNNTGVVSCCYSRKVVIGGNSAGGLAGSSQGTISSSYSTCWVTDQDASVYQQPQLGGLVGRTAGRSNSAKDCYFLAPADNGGPDNGVGEPLTIAQMMQQSSFAGWDFWGTDVDGTGDRWFMPAGSSPVLAWQTEVTGLRRVPDVAGLTLERAKATLSAASFVPGDVSYDFHRTLPGGYVVHAEPYSVAPVGATVDLVAGSGKVYDWTANPGDGSEASPYQIETAGQLESLGDHPELWDKRFVLTADVDLAGRTYATALISPGTHDPTAGFLGTAFAGSFDGQSHVIRNLFIQTEYRGYVGLFG